MVTKLVATSFSRVWQVVVVGCGDVTQRRVRPALRALHRKGYVGSVLYIDIRPLVFTEPLDPTFEKSLQISPEIDRTLLTLRTLGWLGDETLVLVNTSSQFHVAYALAFAPVCGRVAVEKPLALSTREAAMLANWDGKVFALGHQLFKSEMRVLTTEFRDEDYNLTQITSARFTLFETKGVGVRQIDNALIDLGWHGVECLAAPLAAVGETLGLVVEAAEISTYVKGPDQPAKPTAARINLQIAIGSHVIPAEIRVGKGMSSTHKSVEFFTAAGLWKSASLETRENSHIPMIDALVTADDPDMQLGLHDVLKIVEVCEDGCRVAKELPAYKFGRTPHWLLNRPRVPLAVG